MILFNFIFFLSYNIIFKAEILQFFIFIEFIFFLF